jgi:intraflagellar transport protein 88
LLLVSLAPTDPDALRHLGERFDAEGNKSAAFQWVVFSLSVYFLYNQKVSQPKTTFRYHYESFRYFPGCLATLEWMGAYYIESQFPEKAIQYFQRASVVQPSEVFSSISL